MRKIQLGASISSVNAANEALGTNSEHGNRKFAWTPKICRTMTVWNVCRTLGLLCDLVLRFRCIVGR